MALFNPFAKSYSQQERNLFRFLRKNAYFRKLSDEELSNFLPHLYVRNYSRNEAVFFRNDPSQALYFVKEGQVQLNIDVAEDSLEQLCTHEVGSCFGQNALLENTQRIYNAISSAERTELYVLPQVNVMEVFTEAPKIRAKVMTALSENYFHEKERLFKRYRQSYGFFELGTAYYPETQQE
jgi:CRP-like cAMP-binding protein